MKSRKNGSTSIPKEMRGRRHVTILKGGEKGRGCGERGVGVRTREANARRNRRCRKNGQSSKGRSEARKRKWRRDDAGRLVSPFFSSLARLFSFPLLPPSSSPRTLHDRRLKSCPRNFKRNYFGSLSSSFYQLLRANSRWHLRAQSTYLPKIPKCDGLFAAVSREKGIWQKMRIGDWWIRRSCLTIVSYKFLNKSF